MGFREVGEDLQERQVVLVGERIGGAVDVSSTQ
jgi:hypothetical protein